MSKRVPLLDRHKFRDKKINGAVVRKCKYCGTTGNEQALMSRPCPRRARRHG